MYNLIETRNKYKELIKNYMPSIMNLHEKAFNEVRLINRSCYNKKAYLYYLYFYLYSSVYQKLGMGESYSDIYRELHLDEFDCLFRTLGIPQFDVPGLTPGTVPDIVPPTGDEEYCTLEYIDYKCHLTDGLADGTSIAATGIYRKYRNGEIVSTEYISYEGKCEPDVNYLPGYSYQYMDKAAFDARRILWEGCHFMNSPCSDIRILNSPIKESTDPECQAGYKIEITWSDYQCGLDATFKPWWDDEAETVTQVRPLVIATSVEYKVFDGIGSTVAGNSWTNLYQIVSLDSVNEMLVASESQLRVYKDAIDAAILADIKMNLGINYDPQIKINTNQFWEYDSEKCHNELLVNGVWSETVCYMLSDGTFNGDCYYTDLEIEIDIQ
jgi:hypothetical protein